MRRIMLSAIIMAMAGCASTGDLAKTLRYADNRPVGVDKIQFTDLNKMNRGEACTINIFYIFPLWGDGSILTAAAAADINNVQLIGQTDRWYFPFSRNCTVVYGDKP